MPRRQPSASWSSERRGAPGDARFGAFLVLDEGRSNAAVALSLPSPTGVALRRPPHMQAATLCVARRALRVLQLLNHPAKRQGATTAGLSTSGDASGASCSQRPSATSCSMPDSRLRSGPARGLRREEAPGSPLATYAVASESDCSCHDFLQETSSRPLGKTYKRNAQAEIGQRMDRHI
jgi:hypothetical protein